MQLFSNLIGNQSVKQTLQRMIDKGTIHHAMIFSGPSGIGKKMFALEMAKAILGVDHSRKIDAMHHPDVKIFRPEGKTGNHPLASFQQIQALMALEPYEALSRVFIIEEAERMQPVVSNALLKTLEEPSDNNYFFLLTSQPDHIIGTIHSRARSIEFLPVPEKEIYHFLKKSHPTLSEIHWKKNAFLAHGSVSKALELTGCPDDPKREALMELLRASPKSSLDMSSYLMQLEKAFSDVATDQEANPVTFYAEIDRLLHDIVCWYRDLHLLQSGVSVDFVFHFDQLETLTAYDKKNIPSLDKVMAWAEECRLAIERSMKVKVAFEYLLSRCFLPQLA